MFSRLSCTKHQYPVVCALRLLQRSVQLKQDTKTLEAVYNRHFTYFAFDHYPHLA